MPIIPGKPWRESRFVVIWEFRIQLTKRRAFERAYGANGDWAKFFRKGKGYVATELIRDSQQSDRYVTLDYWKSRKHYEAFKRENRKTYRLLDERCGALTARELEIGQFSHRSLPEPRTE